MTRKRKQQLSMKRKIIYGIAGGLVVVVLGFLFWATTPAKPMVEALTALESDMLVQVRQLPDWTVFTPQGMSASTGMIFYPGARVNWRAYAPEAHAIAAQGYRVVIVPMPLNLPFFGVDRASAVIAAFPDTRNWAVGGHSLGGAMAAQFAYNHPEVVKGVFFWGSYPPNNVNLAAKSFKVISIYGTQDGLSTPDKIDASRALLPQDTMWVPIDGGNHGQFGWYGSQAGDNPATITRSSQQDQVVTVMATYLGNLSQ